MGGRRRAIACQTRFVVQLLCPVVVGRGEEMRTLGEALDDARTGRGSLIFLSGEPGIGKSRLTREAQALAESAGMMTLRGRSAQPERPLPYGALIEALRSGLRARSFTINETLRPFHPYLFRLLPELGPAQSEVTESSAAVVQEGLLRLLVCLGTPPGALVVLEDLHWADTDTLSALEYLADNLTGRLLILATLRSEPSNVASRTAEELAARRTALHMRLGRLDPAEVEEMMRATLGRGDVPLDLVEAITRRAEGVPFFVEELISSYITAGEDMDGLRTLPATYRELVAERLHKLDLGDRRLLTAAAVLGRIFDWTLLAPISSLGEEEVLAALRRGVTANLIGPARLADQTSFAFRHALTREAILAELLPPELAELSRRAADAIEAAHPELFGEWCEAVAEMREHAGQPAEAARHFSELGRRALMRGALATAEVILRRARRLAGADDVQVLGVEHVLLETLVQAGKAEEILEIGDRLLQKRGGPARAGTDAFWDPDQVGARVRTRWTTSARQLAETHLMVAQGIGAGLNAPRAAAHLEKAEQLAALSHDRPLLARVASFGATLEMAEGRTEEAAKLARRAIVIAEEGSAPEAWLEALHVQGRLGEALGDLDAAHAAFKEARDIAEREGMTSWLINSLLEIGRLERPEGADRPVSLEQARDLAHQSGAVGTEARAELELAIHQMDRYHLTSAGQAMKRCLDVCRRYHLPLRSEALVIDAALSALGGNRGAMESSIEEALADSRGRHRIEPLTWGAARATLALIEDRLPEARKALARSSPSPASWGFQALLLFLEVVDGQEPSAAATPGWVGLDGGYRICAAALDLGKKGLRQEAASAFEEGVAALPAGWRRHHARRLAAVAALDDAWGDPAAWLEDAATFFETHHLSRLLASTRGLLRRAGVKVPRRGRGDSEVPETLRKLGITSREMDVLRLVAEGVSNRDIADRLFVSPRTVESHVASLGRKTGVASRGELVAFAARLSSPDRSLSR
jgi:ATP/maltotriose-dependent transcriptional regulator MalT